MYNEDVLADTSTAFLALSAATGTTLVTCRYCTYSHVSHPMYMPTHIPTARI